MGINFDYVGVDGLYGNDAAFAREINNLGLIYMLDIHSDQQIFLEKPELYLPERKTAKVPSPKKLKASTDSTTVCKIYRFFGQVRLESDRYQAFGQRGIERAVPFQDGIHL